MNYSYTGSVVGVTVKKAGTYKLEVWGAQGGSVTNGSTSYQGGNGGYAYGNYSATTNSIIYIVVGGKGAACLSNSTCSGGYNGGGNTQPYRYDLYPEGSGGGATHIATRTGLLKNLSSYKSSVLIVAGGGGGANYGYNGGIGGGSSGGVAYGCWDSATGGTQSSGGYSNGRTDCGANSYTSAGFGFGAAIMAGTTSDGSCGGGGGGGGYYGGGVSVCGGGGGGSGYIGGVSSGSMSNGVQTGNGKAKITRQS